MSNITHLTKTTQLIQLTQSAQRTPTSDDQIVAAMAMIILSIAGFFAATLFAIFFTRWFRQWRRAGQDRRYQHYLQQMRQLALRDHLPTVLPAQYFDASDTTPSQDLVAADQCCICAAWHAAEKGYVTPGSGVIEPAGRGALRFCADHAYTKLAHAMLRKSSEEQISR